MAQSQIDLQALAVSIKEAYNKSVEPSYDQQTRQAFQVRADKLSGQFDEVSGRWFDDASAAFSAASDALGKTVTEMQGELKKVQEIKDALDTLSSLIGSLTALLKVLGV